MNEFEMESELEGELEQELVQAHEGELEGEFEGELEAGLEGELAQEGESFLENVLGSAPEGEDEGEFEDEYEFGELELEDGEQFLGKLRSLAGRAVAAVRKASPILGKIGRVAAPLLKTAVGAALPGPFGSILGSLLGEQEGELELGEEELASEFEGEMEFEDEYELEQEALAEAMASMAAESANEFEAEALMGSAATIILTRRERAALRRLVPHLLRGARLLTRALRRRRLTRKALPVVNDIVRRTGSMLCRRAAAGRPISPVVAGTVMARVARRVLGSPRHMKRVVVRNIRTARKVARPARLTARRRRAAV